MSDKEHGQIRRACGCCGDRDEVLDRCGLKNPGLKTYTIVPEASPFTDPKHPFYIKQTDFLVTSILGQKKSKQFEKLALNWWFQVLYLGLIIFEAVASYGVTDLLSKEWAAATLIALPFRLGTLGLLKKELLVFLARETEFRILVVCWILATLGLLDMFNYDIRSAWVCNFSLFVLSNMLQDATAKYSKKNPRFRVYILCLTLSNLNYFVIFSLFYLGYVSDLRMWVLPVQVPTFFDVSEVGANSTFVYVQEIQSVNSSLAIVQILLLYLLKVPYHLLQNNLGIIKIRVFQADVLQDMERRAMSRVEARKQRSVHLRPGSINGRRQRSIKDIDASNGDSIGLEYLGGPVLLEQTREEDTDGEDVWRVLPSKDDFVIPNAPFTISERDNIAGLLFGEDYAEFVVWLFLYEVFCQVLLTCSSVFILPGYWLVLIGVMDKNFTYVGLLTCYYMILQILCGNARITKMLWNQVELKLFAVLLLSGSIGFAFAFSFDIRAFGMLTLNFANLAVTAFADARIRIKPRTVLLTMFYFYFFYVIVLISFYLGWIVDLTDYRVDVGEALGLRPSKIVISLVGFSLYCLEFSLIFGLKYFWLSYVNRGYAILKVGLKYIQVPQHDQELRYYASSRSLLMDTEPGVARRQCRSICC